MDDRKKHTVLKGQKIVHLGIKNESIKNNDGKLFDIFITVGFIQDLYIQ